MILTIDVRELMAFAGQISLTFDDALDEHLDHVAPVLDQHHLLGTFYAHLTAPAFCSRLEAWQALAVRGHELGNHTIFHPADARKPWVREGNAIDRYSLDRMRQELEAANKILNGIDGRTARSFAYPCSNPIVGRRGVAKSLLFKMGLEFTRFPGWIDRLHLDLGATTASYISLVRTMFAAGRGGGLSLASTAPEVTALDPAWLPSAAVENATPDELIGFVERALAAKTWGILQFHGVGGGHRMDCDLLVFREFTSWLAEHHAESVMTVVAGAKSLWGEPRTLSAASNA